MHLFPISECFVGLSAANITTNFTKVPRPFLNNITHELAVDYSSDGEECINQCHRIGCSYMVYQYLPTVRQSHRRIRHAPSVCKLYLFDPKDVKNHLKTKEHQNSVEENVREIMCENNGM